MSRRQAGDGGCAYNHTWWWFEQAGVFVESVLSNELEEMRENEAYHGVKLL